MADFRIQVEGGYKGRNYGLEFAIDKKPRREIGMFIPGTDDEIVIKANKGRHFGDNNEDGTPSTVEVGKWKAPATYYEKGSYGQVFIGEPS